MQLFSLPSNKLAREATQLESAFELFIVFLVAAVAKAIGGLGILPIASAFVFWGACVYALLILGRIILSLIEIWTPRSQLAAFEQSILDAMRTDIQVLARKKFQVGAPNYFGQIDNSKWSKEWDNYVRYSLPETCKREGASLPMSVWHDLMGELPESKKCLLGHEISKAIDEAAAGTQSNCLSLEGATPIGFEVLCIEALTALGWDARATKTTGDQGADIVASYLDEVLVVQCKLYSRPVGNKAVQEIAAAREHYQADYAAVISNSSFTRSAQELAKTNKVRLVSFAEVTKELSPEFVHLAT